MPRKVLQAATGSQMTNPTQGTGSGLDRCTEMTASMILKTYNAGPWASLSTYLMMLKLTERLNNGRDSSAPEDMGIWFPKFLSDFHITAFSLRNKSLPRFADVVACIDRQHVAIGGFNNYAALRLANGQNPYKWTDPPGLGHVLLIVGYDSDKQVVVVHDPLRADPSGQPADYSWTGFQTAQFHDCTEVVGASLPYSENTGVSMGIPDGWHDDGTTLTAPNGVVVIHGFREWILTHPWDRIDFPLAVERALPSIEPGNPSIGAGARQDFRLTSLGWTASRGVYQIWVGQDVLALEQHLAQAVADNATLQSNSALLKQQIATLQQTQGTSLSPALSAAIQQILPALATVAAGAAPLQAAYTAAMQQKPPSVTTPLPTAPAA